MTSGGATAIPTGTISFLFTDIEGSTALLDRVDTDRYRELLEQHQRLLRAAFASHAGIERSTEGDSFFVVFRDAPSAVAAAADAQRELAQARWAGDEQVRVRMGIHTGQGTLGGDDYIGLDVHRAARITAAAHGGQVIVSEATAALVQRSLPPGVELLDLGEYQLRDISGTERLHQLRIEGLPGDFPPLRTGSAISGNLPPRLTSFVGRSTELEAIRTQLSDGRLVTLVGPGGAGKTTLAIECARACADMFRDGQWLVPLEAIDDPDAVAGAMLAVFRGPDEGGRPALELLKEGLSGRELLIVLDNFEHLREAASVVSDILHASPRVKVLVTSRAPLHVPAERIYQIAPLPLPEQSDLPGEGDRPVDPTAIQALLEYPSVQLFVDRAAQVVPGFRLTSENAAAVVKICTRLDGLPLGIELAAARVPLLGAAGVAERLAQSISLQAAVASNAPERQRTLDGAISWSHDLLDPAGRMLFARLSIFAGGWRLDEAEAVCGPATELGAEVLDVLAQLVDQSLVVSRPVAALTRFEMLETIHDFASQQLAGHADRADIGRRHALAYLAMAEEIAPAIRSRSRKALLEHVGFERENLRVAIKWLIEHQDAEAALRLATALVDLRGASPWGVGTGVREATETIVAALSVPGADAPTATRMRALEAAGTAFYYAADNARAGEYYRAQLELAERLEDLQGAADARFNLAWTVNRVTDMAAAIELMDGVERAYRELGDERGLARIQYMRAQQLLQGGRPNEAIAIFERSADRFKQLGDFSYMSMTIGAIGGAYLMLGDSARAAHWLIRGVAVARDMDDVAGMALTLPIGAVAAVELGRNEAAAIVMGAHDSQSTAFDSPPPIALRLLYEQYDPLARARKAMDTLDFEAALARGRAMSVRDAVALLIELDPMAEADAAG